MNFSAFDETLKDRIRGSFWGGAVGDALGAPIEFSSIGSIRRQFGPQGITGYVEFEGGRGAFTDDTQMSLFTAEGLMCALSQLRTEGSAEPVHRVHEAYLRWLTTQDRAGAAQLRIPNSGYLMNDAAMQELRAPGMTCLSGLRAASKIGEPVRNSSKGCGTVMRAAPVAFSRFPEKFRIACEISALTHGHVNAALASGALVEILCTLTEGASMDDAADRAVCVLHREENGDELAKMLENAVALSRVLPPEPESVEMLGEGWVADEALAIALFCALKFPDDFRAGVLLAANISGDCDSTASVAGNILGTRLGLSAIPSEWRENLMGKEILERVTEDFCLQDPALPDWSTRYPARF